MIESGLGLTASCLPTIYFLVKKNSTLKVSTARFNNKGYSVASDIRVEGGPASFNSHALKEVNPAFQESKLSNGWILIKKTFDRTEVRVQGSQPLGD